MNQKTILLICQDIYRRFPTMKGRKPRVRSFNMPKAKPSSRSPKYLLTFKGQSITSSGKTIPNYVRVVANDQGRILKITMSR